MKNCYSTESLPIGSLGTVEVSLLKIVFTGKKPGKRIVITAGLHGNETTSLFVLQELIELVRVCGLASGELIIFPVTNPLGLAFDTRREPLDGENLNREFPGAHAKSFGKKITATVWEEIQSADFVIDLHTFSTRQCGFTGVMVKTGKSIDSVVSRILCSMQTDCVWLIDMSRDEDKRFYGALDVVAAEKNIPACTLEMERNQNVTDGKIMRYTQSIMRACVELGLLDLEYSHTITTKDIPLYEGRYLYSDDAGLFFPQKKVFEKIQKGMSLGSVVNLLNFEKKEMISPIDGTILTVRYRDFIRTGSKIASIGTYVCSLKEYL